MTDPAAAAAQGLKEAGCLPLTADDIHLVPHLRHKGAVGHEHLAAPDSRAHQHPVGMPAVVLGQGNPRHAVAFQQGKADHLHQPPGEGLHTEGRRHPQQPGNLLSRRILGVNDHTHPDLTLEEVGLLIVLRAADPGHRVLGAQLLGNQAADDIQLIGAGHRHHQIRAADPRLQQYLYGGAAALHTQNIQHSVGVAQSIGVFVDQDQIVILPVAAELLGQGISHLAVAYDDDLHIFSFSSSGDLPVFPALCRDSLRMDISTSLISAPIINTVAVRYSQIISTTTVPRVP